MAAVSEGADPTRLRELGGQLTGAAERIEGTRQQGGHLLEVLTDSWQGNDLEQFAATWPDCDRALGNAGETVRAMAADLRRNADDQEGASAAEGAAGGSPPSSGSGGGGNASGDPHWTESDDKVYGDLDPEVEDAWAEMSDDERDAVLDAIIAEQAARYGIDPADITYDSSMADNEFGSWNDGSRTLTLNPSLLDDPQMAINTIVHEMRHAGQHEMVRDANPSWWESLWGTDPEYHGGTGPETVEAWQENFDDYQSTDNGDTFGEYWDQPVEVDAREAGRDYVDDMGAEDLQQLREAAEAARQEPSVPQPTSPPPLPGPPGPAPTPPSPTPGPRPTPPPTPGG